MQEDQCKLLEKIVKNSRVYFIIRAKVEHNVYEVTKMEFSGTKLRINGWSFHIGDSEYSYGSYPDAPPAWLMGHPPARDRSEGAKLSDIVGFFYENPEDNPNAKPIMAFDAAKYN